MILRYNNKLFDNNIIHNIYIPGFCHVLSDDGGLGLSSDDNIGIHCSPLYTINVFY